MFREPSCEPDLGVLRFPRWLAELGLTVDRSTVYRWVRRYLPLPGAAARRYRRPVGARWRVDETYWST